MVNEPGQEFPLNQKMTTNGEHGMQTTRILASEDQSQVLQTNKVLRNTYALLSLTLLFSAVTAGVAATLNLPHPGIVLTLVGYFGLLFLTTNFRNSSNGLLSVFALTGFMGYTLGPIINAYLSMNNGPSW